MLPVFRKQSEVTEGHRDVPTAIARQQKQRVLQIKDHRIDETSLAIILERRKMKVQVCSMAILVALAMSCC